MFQRTPRRFLIAFAAVAVLVPAGIAAAAVADRDDSDDSSLSDLSAASVSTDSTPDSVSSSVTVTSATTPASVTASEVHEVADAGRVTVGRDGAELVVLEAIPNAGWTVDVDRLRGVEVEVTFSGPRRVDFNAELEDGQIRVQVRDGGEDVTSTSTPTTVDDAEDNDDRDDGNVSSSRHEYSFGGGHAVVTFDGVRLHLEELDITPGFTVEDRREDADRIELRVRQGDHESRLEVTVDGSRVRGRVEDHQGDGDNGDDNSGHHGGDDD
jgi:hypothetical protein